MCIHKISKCLRILENQYRGPIINRVRVLIKISGCAKYEYDPLQTASCRVVTGVGPKHQSVSVFMKFQVPHRISGNEHRDPIINKVHAPTKSTKYEPAL